MCINYFFFKKKERPEDIEKFVVHNPILGIEYPPKSDEIFAVFEIQGKHILLIF